MAFTHQDASVRRDQQLIPFADLALFGISFSRPHLYRMIKAGAFPEPVRLGPNRVAFRREAIQEYIDNLETGTLPPRRGAGRPKTKRASKAA